MYEFQHLSLFHRVWRLRIQATSGEQRILAMWIEVKDTAHLDRVLKAIERVDGVIRARRVRAWQAR